MCKIKCDNCSNFETNGSQTVEICHAQFEGSRLIAWITEEYIQERMNGSKLFCKGFKKIS